MSKTETILQIHGVGPFASTVVEAVYELTDNGILLLTSLLLPGGSTSTSPPDCFALRVNAKVRGEAGESIVVGARCSPSNQITQYWVQRTNGERFWAGFQELKMTFAQSTGLVFAARADVREYVQMSPRSHGRRVSGCQAMKPDATHCTHQESPS